MEFKIEMISRHPTAFNRQVAESVYIMNDNSQCSMNRKTEFNSNGLPTLVGWELHLHRLGLPDGWWATPRGP